MLYSVLIFTASGLVVFVKEFIPFDTTIDFENNVNSAGSNASSEGATHHSTQSQSQSQGVLSSRSGQLAGVLTAILNVSVAKVGGPPSYIECDGVAISLCSTRDNRLTCAIFHGVGDGESFGQIICNQLLRSFTNLYRHQIDSSVSRMDAFTSFTTKIPFIISQSIQIVLDTLSAQRGVTIAIVVQSDTFESGVGSIGGSVRDRLTVSANSQSNVQPINDHLLLLSTHDALLGHSADVMATVTDNPEFIKLCTDTSIIYVRRLEVQRATLVIKYENRIDDSFIQPHIDNAASLVKAILKMADDMKT